MDFKKKKKKKVCVWGGGGGGGGEGSVSYLMVGELHVHGCNFCLEKIRALLNNTSAEGAEDGVSTCRLGTNILYQRSL